MSAFINAAEISESCEKHELMEVLTTKAKEFYCNPMITWLNKIKFNVCQNFTFSYNSQVLLRCLTKVFTVTMLYYLFTWSSVFKRHDVATRDQR